MKKVRTYDEEKDLVQLDKDCFFSFATDDGFSFNLLSAHLVIDYDFRYTLQFKAASKNYPIETGTINNAVQDVLTRLIDLDYNTIQRAYDPFYPTMSVSSMGGQFILINLDEDTTNIGIVDGAHAALFPSPAEQLIYQLNEHLKLWTAQRRKHYD